MIKTRQKLASQYGISPRTFRRWLKKRNIHLSKELLKPRELERIYAAFGKPDCSPPLAEKSLKTGLFPQIIK